MYPWPGTLVCDRAVGGDQGVDVADRHRSLWLTTSESDEFPALEGDVQVDVAVVGGGITGVTVAQLLKREGKTVALLELGRIGQATTGNTTAKLTVGQGLAYAELTTAHGPEAARLFGESNRDAIREMASLAVELGVDCDWEPESNFVYTESSGRLGKLDTELQALRGAGITLSDALDDLPCRRRAIRVERSALSTDQVPRRIGRLIPGDGSMSRADMCNYVEREKRRRRDERRSRAASMTSSRPSYRPLSRSLFCKPTPESSLSRDSSAPPRGMYITATSRHARFVISSISDPALIVGGYSRRPADIRRKAYRPQARIS